LVQSSNSLAGVSCASSMSCSHLPYSAAMPKFKQACSLDTEASAIQPCRSSRWSQIR
jgi:hypothetical protein